METAPASTTSAAPAAGAASGGSSEMTPAGAASQTQPVTTVSTGAPGTSSANQPAGAASGKWYDTYDADTKDYLTQKGFQDPKAVVDSYRNLEKLRGVPQERLLKLPEAGDEKGLSEVFEKLGKPATPEGYGLQAKDPNKPGFTDWAKGAFHKLNLTSQQGQELVKQFNEFSQAQEQASAAEHTAKVQEQVGALKKEWGAAYNQKVARAQAAYRQFGIPDAAIDSLEKTIGFDGVLKLFDTLGSKVGEHSFVAGDPGQSFGEGVILTPEQANARIKALKGDTEWSNRYLKGDVKARQEMERLFKMANP
jgi:hypothetical protein